MSSELKAETTGPMANRPFLRLAATLLLTGQVLYILVTQFHQGGEANDHPSIFAKYASNGIWGAVHVGQFVGAAILLSGLVVLASSVDVGTAVGRWTSRLGAVSAVVALAMYGVLQAVDGVANKQVDAAWVSASATDKAARFASAESMRWLEWGARSYHDFALGFALLLLAVGAISTAAIPRAISYLMGLSGLVYWAQGWIVGAEGFSGTHTVLILLAWVLSVVWMVWLAIAARRPLAQPMPLEPRVALPQT